MLMLLLMFAFPVPASQTVVDHVLVRFGEEIVTQLDVRQARMLKLVDTTNDSDQAWIDALVNRRLILADIRRNPPPDPSQGEIDARHQQWAQRIGAQNVTELLERAGMSEAALRGWMRDDLRIESYLSARFGDRTAERDAWIALLRQRAGLR